MDKAFNYSIQDGFLWSEVNLKGEKKFYVEGYASTIDKDKAGEIISHEAQGDIYNQILNETITMDIEHEQWYDEQGQLLPRPRNDKIPVAKIVAAELRPQGVWIKAEINRNIPSFNSVWGSIREGFLKAFSVAFYPVAKAGNVIKKLNLINVTLTGSPVNPNATFQVAMKSAKAYLDSMEQADVKSSLISESPRLDNPADKPDFKEPEVKNNKEDNKMSEKEFECKTCDKEFPSKEALDAHYEEVHSKKENEAKAEAPDAEKKESAEHEKVESKEAEKEEHKNGSEEKDEGKAKVKAEPEESAELKALREENIRLKAELAKPVMKATMESAPKLPTEVNVFVTPLGLLK